MNIVMGVTKGALVIALGLGLPIGLISWVLFLLVQAFVLKGKDWKIILGAFVIWALLTLGVCYAIFHTDLLLNQYR